MISRPSYVGSLAPGREYFDAGSSRDTSPLSTMSASRRPVKPLVIDPISKAELRSNGTGEMPSVHATASRVVSVIQATAMHAGVAEAPRRSFTTASKSGSAANEAAAASPQGPPGMSSSVQYIATMDRVTYRACHLCEALCGLEIRTRGDEIVSVRGDAGDSFSRGHICPKAVALIDVHNDPDRLRGPVRRVGAEWKSISWDEAFELVARRFAEVQQRARPERVGRLSRQSRTRITSAAS